MTETLLIRHAECSGLGERLNGRTPGVTLNAAGARQAAALGAALSDLPIAAIYSGPLERARATAAAIALPHALEPRVLAALDEVDYGAWTGRTFEELAGRSDWQAWQRHRSSVRIPGGELLVEVQARVIAAITQLQQRHPDECLAIITHAELVRLVLAHCLAIPIDLALRIEVTPASVSRIRWYPAGPAVTSMGVEPAAWPALTA